MKIVLCSCVFLLFWFCFGIPNDVNAVTPEALPAAIDAVISQSQYLGSLWGVVVELQNETTNEWMTLYSKNADQFFQPASNNKLLTTSAALYYFGINHTISTPVLIASPDIYGTSSTVCVIGAGDASIGEQSMDEIVNGIALSNIQSIGDLFIDDTLFPPFPSTWAWEDITAYYGAAPNSIVFNENVIQVIVNPGSSVGSPALVSFSPPVDEGCILFQSTAITTDENSQNTLNAYYSLSSPNPATLLITGNVPINTTINSTLLAAAAIQPSQRFGCVLASKLSESFDLDVGTLHVGSPCPLNSSNDVTEFSISSPTFNTTMYYTLQVSDNLYAESYLRLLGSQYPPAYEGIDAQSNGIIAVKEILNTKLGVNSSLFYQNDGSGLSRENLVSPQSLIETLKAMDSTPYASAYITFLPVAGESGTLADRYIGTTAQGVLHAKTGSLTGACALSGFVLVPGQPKVLFSIIVNDGSVSDTVIREGIDTIGVLLSQLTSS